MVEQDDNKKPASIEAGFLWIAKRGAYSARRLRAS